MQTETKSENQKPISRLNKSERERFVKDLSIKFSCCLLAEIGRAKLDHAVRLNRGERNPDICHSCDFCDANQVMLDTWRVFTGSQMRLGSALGANLHDHFVNLAWGLAKTRDFYL